MIDNEQPEKKMMPDTMFVAAVAVVGCFFGLVLETWWVLVVGVLVVTTVYAGRKMVLPLMSRMSPQARKRGQLTAWGAVTLIGLVLVGCAFVFYARAGGSYMAIPQIIGIAGIWTTSQGIANVRRLAKPTTPDESA